MKITHLSARILQLAPWVLALTSAAVTVGAYLQALHYPFVSDDAVYITENTKLAGLHLSELWRLFTSPYNDFSEFLPLRDLSYWFDITLFGLNPAAFRVHNIILYLLCLPLVYGTTLSLWRYFRSADAASAPWAAATVTALFALHPAHVEAVVWISGRKDVLSALFSLIALWLAVNAKREHGLSSRYALAALIALLAAILSKATAVAVAPIIALLWIIFWCDIPKQDRRRTQLLWPVASLLLAACAVLIFTANSTVKEPTYFGIEMVTRALAVLGWLARLAVTPESRHFFYPVLEDKLHFVTVAMGATVLAASIAGGVMLLRRRLLEGFVLVVFLLFCSTYVQLIPYKTVSLVSDRFIALAVWPVVVLVVSLSWRLSLVPRMVLLLVIALMWGLPTLERPRDWRSYEALIDIDFRAFPGFSMPAVYKSDIQLSQGLIGEAEETAGGIVIPEVRNNMLKLVKAHQAVTHSTSAGDPNHAMTILLDFGLDLQEFPAQARWNTTLGGIWRINRNYLEYEWRNLVRYFPDDMLLRYNAGSSLLSNQKYESAIVHLRAATESQHLPEPVRGTAFENLGVALLNGGYVTKAEVPLRAALEQSPPDLRAYCPLSEMYKRTGRHDKAERAEAECRNLALGERSLGVVQ